MTLNSPSNTPQQELESTTTCGSQSQLNQNQEKTGQKSIEFCAGLYEGEGTLTHFSKDNPRKNNWQLKIKMADEDVLEDFCRIAGVGKIYGPYHSASYKEHHKPTWQYMVYKNKDVLSLLKRMLPYLGKRRTAKAVEVMNLLTTYEDTM